MTDTTKRPLDTSQADTDEKVAALLDVVTQHRDAECAAIDRSAAVQSDEIVKTAHRDARTKVSAVIADERRNGKLAIDKQNAQIETAKRQNFQDRENAFLAAAWPELRAELDQRWADVATRKAWIAATIERACAHLNPGAWRIEHPSNWSPDELNALGDRIREFSGSDPAFQVVEDVKVGVRIIANDVMVDATADGLLANRREISALLLAELFSDAEDAS